MVNWILSLLLIPVLAGLYLTKTITDERVKSRHLRSDIRYIPSPETARFLSFGFKEAWADVYWIETINYFGEQLSRKKDRNYQYLKPYLNLILHLDPYFTIFYDWASTAFIYNALPISREGLVNAARFANLGIQKLHSVGRYDASLIRKGAFNYALDAQIPGPSVPYFALAGRSFKNERDLLLVGSSYAVFANETKTAENLKAEYLGYKVYETDSREDIQEAIVILSSPAFNSQAADFVRNLRLEAESDEEVKKLVERRLSENPLLARAMTEANEFQTNKKIQQALRVDLSKNWMPPALHLLLNL